MAKKKAAGNGLPRVSVGSKWAWMEYFDPEDPEDSDSPPYLLEVRKDLSFDEADTLKWDVTSNPPVTEQWEKLAPFVRDWNLDDATGEPIPAPKVAGGKQFNYLPAGIFWKVWKDLKWRSSGDVDSKRYSASASRPETAPGAPTEMSG